MGLRGGSYSGRRSRGGGLGSSSSGLTSASAEYRKKCAASYAPKTSSPKSWFQDMEDKSGCYLFYRARMGNMKILGEGHSYYAKGIQELEDSCGEYKSLWSKWWKEKDDKKLCERWKTIFERNMTRYGLEYCEKYGMKKSFENACKGVPSRSSSSSRSLRHLIDKVLEYCI